MSKLFFLFTILCIASADKWALFISARDIWENYSISSTICRGYDLAHDAGFDEDHMIYMGYRDVWDAEENPFPGQIFTDPSEGPGIDYAAGCKNHLDYDDDYVTIGGDIYSDHSSPKRHIYCPYVWDESYVPSIGPVLTYSITFNRREYAWKPVR